jgi:hypothetical protein
MKLTKNTNSITRLRIIYDMDHGTDLQGWYARATNEDGAERDIPLDIEDGPDADADELVEEAIFTIIHDVVIDFAGADIDSCPISIHRDSRTPDVEEVRR